MINILFLIHFVLSGTAWIFSGFYTALVLPDWWEARLPQNEVLR